MSELDDDIARIAALRGGSATNYAVRQRHAMRAMRQVHSSEIRDIFRPPPDWRRELAIFDCLPRASRRLIMELPLAASPGLYASLLDRMADETALIDAVYDQLPGIVHDWALRHYGRDHPTARRLP